MYCIWKTSEVKYQKINKIIFKIVSSANTTNNKLSTFASETWTITNTKERKQLNSEMQYLRSILGVTRFHRMQNTKIRTLTGVIKNIT